MALKNFKTRNGIDVDTYTLPNTVIQATVKTNSATTVDTIDMSSFTSAEYLVTIVQGSKIRTSKVVMHTDGSSVDMTEYGITETGGSISGVVVSATTSSTNAVLQVTITDAATTIARVKIARNLNVTYTAGVPDAPTIGTATGGVEQASITFTAPFDNGGATISSYTATSSPGSITGSASSSPVTVLGLIGGTAYTFTVTATNSAGTSAASSASNSVTPTASQLGGYVAGGRLVTTTTYNTINKILFANDTRSTLSATLTDNTTGSSGMANSSMAGYFSGGSPVVSSSAGSATSRIDKITFSDDSKSTLSATLSAAKLAPQSMANSGTAGYIGGGQATSYGFLTAIDKLLFSNESRSTISATLNIGAYNGGGMANSGTAGYFAVGNRQGPAADCNRVDKIPFSTETRTYFTLTKLRGPGGAFANSGTAGYVFLGDDTNGNLTTGVSKILFSNDSISELTPTLSNRSQTSGFAKSGTAGYIAGGGTAWNGGGSSFSSVDKLTFSTDTITAGVCSLATGVTQPGAMANSGII